MANCNVRCNARFHHAEIHLAGANIIYVEFGQETFAMWRRFEDNSFLKNRTAIHRANWKIG
jgi:hypothetical protein